MIARLIAWSARNLLLVLFGTGFAAAAGIYALVHLPLDAIPDLSDTQVIVYTEYPGQAPQVIEDQVTYPLTTAMLTVPKSKVVRGFSFFGVSFVYVIFEDGTDIYWARSRVLEFLNGAASRLPAGATPTIGPDATGVGWVYQYAVMSKELNLSDTRAIQDWNVKNRFREIASSLPGSVEIVPVYDRSNLINAAIETLKRTLLEESVVVALVCIVFLLHFRSALVAIIMLPVGVLMAFGTMKLLGLGSNIMSLGGIAIAIGAMVDAAIVMIENAHKHLERAEPGQSRVAILIEAASQVGPALFFSLLIITVSFMPIFTLEAQEGRLFSPLAFTKTFAMAAAAVLSVTLVPALMVIFVRGQIVPEHKNPINRFLIWIYRPLIRLVLRAKIAVILLAICVLAVTIWPARQL